ncbi:MAG: DUF1302 family protein [Rhodospirillaceae bacterium]|nr:DUF1302 family protein [Rhodospirillaceae bacterium]
MSRAPIPHHDAASRWPRAIAAGAVLAVGAIAGGLHPASAAELHRSADLSVRWDTTVRYTVMHRLRGPAAALLSDPNGDDGNRNFATGVVSNRADMFTEFGLARGPFGLEVSAAAWFDAAYRRRTDHDAAATFNPVSVPVGRLPRAVRRLHGADAEVVNAYVYGAFEASGATVSVRAGRQSLLWGESLFFAENGIAAGMAPIDAIKALTVPSSKAAEVYMPVGQIWAAVQPNARVSVEAYWQPDWRRSRLPGAGSYFSAADFLDVGGERLNVGPNQFFARGSDETALDGGQVGLAVRFSAAAGDYGVYALRTHARDPQLYLRFGRFIGPPRPTASGRERGSAYGLAPGLIIAGPGNPLRNFYGLYGDPATGEVGRYALVYPEGIQVFGASLNGYLGDQSFAGEVSVRRHTPLVSEALFVLPNVTADNDARPLYARGDTLHVQASVIAVLGPGRAWDDATLAAEVAANRRLRIGRNSERFDPTRDRNAVSLRMVFEPQFFSVLPGLDLSLPVGIGLGVIGRSSVIAGQTSGVGDVEIGVRATYRAVWSAALRVTSYFGPAARQPLADRDAISLSIQRTF